MAALLDIPYIVYFSTICILNICLPNKPTKQAYQICLSVFNIYVYNNISLPNEPTEICLSNLPKVNLSKIIEIIDTKSMTLYNYKKLDKMDLTGFNNL